MNTPNQRLRSLHAEDIMSRDVIVVTANSTMSEAADVLCERQVSGAPVVDEVGRCVGVLSGSDYVHSEASHLEPGASSVASPHSSLGCYQIEDVQHDLVRRHMTPAVQTIDKKCSLLRIAHCMCGEHLHRLIVLDDHSVPVGVVTSLDLIAALVTVIEKEQPPSGKEPQP
ncbi:MAG: CBS domain-containing protein [Planctomycetes bacterium]|nr:CBS domain-containing protein [Planctomycetota bacterium]